MFKLLKREQREAVGLLQMGTFLEYFDLMLYVHMAVLLNELFFPKTDPHAAALIAAFAFCSTYVLRPIGALLFGWIGDNIGRKPTVVITTIMMAASCIIMANLPTYEQIGITATWLITLCRVLQGISSLGEITASEVYLTELIPEPQKNPIVASLRIVDDFGSMVAILIAALVTINGMNWRIAFWIGATIAAIGSVARIKLRESPEFIQAKSNLINNETKNRKNSFNRTTTTAYFFIQAGYPYFFFVVFIFCGNLLKTKYGFSPEQVIQHNLFVALVALLSSLIYCLSSIYVNPLKILFFKSIFALILSFLTPFLLLIIKTPHQLLLFQCLVIFFALSGMPGQAIFLKTFPVLKRMSRASILYAVARALMLIITSVGSIYTLEWLGDYGLWVISIPVCLTFIWGVNHFAKLEKQRYPKVYPSILIQPNKINFT